MTKALSMEFDERNIGGRYNKMIWVEFHKYLMDAVIRLIYWLVNMEGGGGGDTDNF